MVISMVSFIKSCYNLQNLDMDYQIIHRNPSPIRRLIVSVLWFSSVFSFRGISVAVQCFCISLCTDYPGLQLVPVSIILASNLVLSWWFLKSSSFILHGLMASVAPARFISWENHLTYQIEDDDDDDKSTVVNEGTSCAKKVSIIGSKANPRKTFEYLVAYTLLNSLLHMTGLFLVTVMVLLDPHNFKDPMALADKTLVLTGMIPAACILFLSSILSTFVYWQLVLGAEVCLDQWKYPEYADIQNRLDSFAGLPSQMHEYSDRLDLAKKIAPALAKGGFFYTHEEDKVACYECGEVINMGLTDRRKDVNLHQIMIRHCVLASVSYRDFFKVDVAEHLAKLFREENTGPLILKTGTLFADPGSERTWCQNGLNQILYYAKYENRLKSFQGDECDFGGNLTDKTEVARRGYVREEINFGLCIFCGHVMFWSMFNTTKDVVQFGHKSWCPFLRCYFEQDTEGARWKTGTEP